MAIDKDLPSAKIRELYVLYNSGLINDEEYNLLKTEYIKSVTDMDSDNIQHDRIDLKNDNSQKKIVDAFNLEKKKSDSMFDETNVLSQKTEHKKIAPDKKGISQYERPNSSKNLIVIVGLLTTIIIVLLGFVFIRSSNSVDNNDTQVEKMSFKKHLIVKDKTKKDNSTPVKTVKSWITALGENNFSYAYSLLKGKQWQGGLEWFSSEKAYGGIYKTKILECRLVENTGSETFVFIKYDAYDSSNGNGTYSQILTLKNSNNGWFIYRSKNTNNH